MPNILIFDGNPDTRYLVADILREDDYNVYTAANLGEVRAIASTAKISLLLADPAMPNRECSLDSIRRLGAVARRDVPLIAFTAHPLSLEEAREAFRRGGPSTPSSCEP